MNDVKKTESTLQPTNRVQQIVMRKIIRADRSPLNPKNWCYELECGHEVWDMGRKTRKKELRCDTCERIA